MVSYTQQFKNRGYGSFPQVLLFMLQNHRSDYGREEQKAQYIASPENNKGQSGAEIERSQHEQIV